MSPRDQPCRELNIVVFGAGGVGKSCLTAQFVHKEWIESYDPTIEDTYRTQVEVDGRQLMLEILDTAGTEQFVAMRDLYMKTGQGFVLVFSITSESSFSEIATLREEIMRIKDDTNVPMVMVGNKCDLEEQRAIERPRAFSASREWSVPYYETSARTCTNVRETFADLCRQIIRKDDERGVTEERDDEGKYGNPSRSRRRRRSGKMKSKHQRCVIL